MSESERRHGYAYNRVLIETARILDPQFDDAVVFLSGAQIEMLRNITQYLNRRDTYVSEQFLGYYLAPTTADYDDILEIVADLEETLMGNPNVIWGYADRWFVSPYAASTGESNTKLYTDVVPAGYVYTLEHWAILHQADTPCNVFLMVDSGANQMRIYVNAALASHTWAYEITRLTLKEGDRLWLQVSGLPDTKNMYLRAWGSMMVVPEE